jgi:6-phosphogluconolactonase (cycloisomerase 2 family)
MYKITDEGNRNFKIIETGYGMTFSTKLHAIERVLDPQDSEDLKTFYALGESNTNGNFPPNVVEIKFFPKTGIIKRSGKETWLEHSDKVIDGISPATHHGDITPDHKYYVAPVSDGKVYFIDRKTMKIAKEIETSLDSKHKGLGAAHVEFSKSQKVAIITNHFSNYITVIDMSNPDVSKYKIKAQVKIGKHAFIKPPEAKHLMQPHFAKVSDDGKYFYTAASHDGIFVRVDLEKLDTINKSDLSDLKKLKDLGVLKSVDIGGVIEQSHS